jgi:hypothetical protein
MLSSALIADADVMQEHSSGTGWRMERRFSTSCCFGQVLLAGRVERLAWSKPKDRQMTNGTVRLRRIVDQVNAAS